VLVLIIGLVLNFTPWGITVLPILILLTLLIIINSTLAYFMTIRLTELERIDLHINLNLRNWLNKRYSINKVATIILVCSISLLVGTVIFSVFHPKINQNYTEFYLLDMNGNTDYNLNLTIGNEAQVIVGLINREQSQTRYSIEILINGQEQNVIGPIVLKNSEKYQEPVDFIPNKIGDNQKVEFILHKNDNPAAYLNLFLTINVNH